MLKNVFDTYGNIYKHILSRIYPAKNSTGFPERNLSVNFSKAYEYVAKSKEQDAYTWFEFQFGDSNNLHVDAVIINNTLHEMFVIESKRFSNPISKMKEIGEDIDRIYNFIKEIRKENIEGIYRINLDLIEKSYGVILADVWSETSIKKEILQSYKEGDFLYKFKEKIGKQQVPDDVQYFVQSLCDNENTEKYNLVSFCWNIR